MNLGRFKEPAFLVLLASILVYIACLSQDSFCVNGSCSDWPGWGVLMLGWIEGAIHPRAGVSWYANPVLYVAWFFISRADRKKALRFSVAALLLAAWFLLVRNVAVSEQGALSDVTGYALGYWLWLASTGLAVVAALLVKSKAQPS